MLKHIPCIDFEKIMNSGQLFRMYFDGKKFLLYSADKLLLIKEKAPETYEFSCTEAEFDSYWANYFDCATDYEALFARVSDDDKFVKAAAEFSYGIRVLNQDLFEMMISFIISQQKRIPEIRKCIEALSARFGEKKCVNGIEYYAFPTAEAIAAAGPDGVKGLSLGYRERYIYETAVKYVSDTFIQSEDFRKLTYPQARDYLKTYCGIGEKVANCICLFALGYKDAFPIDVHIKDILHREYGVGEPEKYRKLPDSTFARAAEEQFADFAGARGIVQQWIFAWELVRKVG